MQATRVWERVREVDWKMKMVCRRLRSLLPPEDAEEKRREVEEEEEEEKEEQSGQSACAQVVCQLPEDDEYYDCIDCISSHCDHSLSIITTTRTPGQHLTSGKRALSLDHMNDFCTCSPSSTPPPPSEQPPPPPPSPPLRPPPPHPSRLQVKPPPKGQPNPRSSRPSGGAANTKSTKTHLKDPLSSPPPPPHPPPRPQSADQIHQHVASSGKGTVKAAEEGKPEESSVRKHRKFWNIRLSNTRSLPALLGRNRNPTAARAQAKGFFAGAVVGESRSESSSCSSSKEGGSSSLVVVGDTPPSHHKADGGQENGGSSSSGGGAGGGGGRKDAVCWKKLSDVISMVNDLKNLWNNHRSQLQDALDEQEKDRTRSSRQEQCLGRARQAVSSLRQQRRQLLEQMEHKEEEMVLVLRQHKNEAAFLRRKVLGFLEEKRSTMTGGDEKCDLRLKSTLETLLSLYLDRERFLGLDLAKQNKINELKLLVVRQQLAIEELQEQKSDLHQALNTLMQFSRENRNRSRSSSPGGGTLPRRGEGTPTSTTTTTTTTAARAEEGPGTCSCTEVPNGPGRGWWGCAGCCPHGGGCGGRGRGMGLADVLRCERTLYLPGHSTSPELAAVTVYGIGGEQSALTCPPEEVFDASRHFCQADGDHHNMAADTHRGENCDAAYAEQLLLDLTLHGPGSATFTLSDLQP